MVIAIGADHRGYDLKQQIIKELENKYDFKNFGTNSTDSADYPKYAFLVGEEVRDNKAKIGLLICGSSIGITIAANKVKGILCANPKNIEETKITREHNNSNILSLSSSIPIEIAIKMINTFIETKFIENERYIRRINQIKDYENNNV